MREIKIKVQGFRGITAAEISMRPIAMVAGRNGQGKSSLCQAVAAALTCSAVPFFRSEKPEQAVFNKTESEGLLHDGDKLGAVRVDIGSDIVQLAWPSHKLTVTGQPPVVGKVAAGLINTIDMGSADRANYFTSILASAPAESDFAAALAGAGFVPDHKNLTVAKIWGDIEISGWDAVHKGLRTEITKNKGAWEHATGEKYGSEKAENYRPQGYSDDLDGVVVTDLENAVAAAKQQVDDLIGSAALADDKLKELENKAAREKEVKRVASGMRKTKETCLQSLVDINAELDKVRSPHIFGCPHCGGVVHVLVPLKGQMSIEKSELTEKDIADMAERKKKAEYAQAGAIEDSRKATERYAQLQNEYLAVKGSIDALADIKARKSPASALSKAQESLAVAQLRVRLKEKVTDAAGLHGAIINQQIVLNTVASSGLRLTKLKEKMEVFNQVMAGFCAVAKYGVVKLTDDLEVTYGDRNYMLLSDSEKYRCRAIIQVGSAVYEKSNIAIFDGADILDVPGRKGLLMLLRSLGSEFNALVAMTIGKQESVIDLGDPKIAMGSSYWMQDGTCGPVSRIQS